ncbi:hypothetical protein BU24DRAFT_467190 [Aaosphaeria arxii CBS 175.79]|uniref:F-box domain-containing protein n=1 Tax=Aaosphaeria arxii CBS 175.79 TaxID=1450172 RepID=A0A6A5XCS6_9PLEO|nr:uncharacterized protein BU24DRAFT_467190 [Aaosphaeria arxii CBS 175.79]KAF2010574.1 hypothetical protein BU24DRAFT_467190 [Aaosphaeria arxii CBS 175.79]
MTTLHLNPPYMPDFIPNVSTNMKSSSTARVLRITHSQSRPNPPRTPPKPPVTSTPIPLEVVELLEAILLRLPLQVLLTTAQRVCKRWHAVICSSRRIQRALYLLPNENQDVPGTRRAYIPNPLIARAFFAYLRFDVWTEHTRAGTEDHVDVALKMTSLEYPASIRYGAASWRKMLVTQPLIKEVVVTDTRVAPYYDDFFVDEAHNTAGVKMGDLLVLDDK